MLRIINTLSGALELARRWKMIRENPCRDVDKIDGQATRAPYALTRADVFRLAGAAVQVASIDEKNLVIVAAFAGGRRGELHGLRSPNVDLTDGHESVRFVEQSYRGERKERTKTRSSSRLVPLSPEASEALRSQQVEGRSSALGLVFPAPRGGPWAENNFHERRWQPIREAAGLSDLHFRDLRHHFVTYARTTLELAPSLTEQLAGHSDERTHQHYTHPTAEGNAIIRARMRRVYGEEQGG